MKGYNIRVLFCAHCLFIAIVQKTWTWSSGWQLLTIPFLLGFSILFSMIFAYIHIHLLYTPLCGYNHQCMVLVCFDTLFALGHTRWKCNLKRQPLNLIIYNMTRVLLRPNNTNGDEHTCRKLCLGLAGYLELWFNNGMLSLTVANYKGSHSGSYCNLLYCHEKLKSK